MIRLLALTSFVAVLATAPGAETIRIRTGDHADFTRVVLYLPPGGEADVSKDGDRIRIGPGGTASGFDSEGMFDRISRNRIAAARTLRDGRLELALACPCGHEVTNGRGRLLILDVTDRRSEEKAVRLRFGGTLSEVDSALAQDRTLSFPESSPKPTANVRREPPNSVPPPALGPTDDDYLARQARVLAAEERLVQQLARATTQGLLDRTTRATAPKPAERPARPPLAPPSTPPGRESPLRAESVIDRDRSIQQLDAPTTSAGDSCHDDETLDAAAWGGTAPFGVELGRLRAELYDALDTPSPEARFDLARFYIHYGFGAEAIQLLEEAPDQGETWRLLLSMARIVDSGHDSAPGAFHGMSDCDSNAALWGVLAQDPLPPDLRLERKAILRGISGMPLELRRHLAPMLAKRLTEAGEPDLAESVLRTLRGAPQPADPSEAFARARIAVERGATTEAEPLLAGVAEANAPESPSALAALIDSLIDKGDPVPPDLVDLADAYAVELRGQPDGPLAAEAAILAIAANGRHTEALDRLDARDDAEGVDWMATRSRIAALVTRDADDPSFLGLSRRIGERTPEDLDPAVANAMAERLVDLGFGDAALSVLVGPSDGKINRDRRLLRARIALEDRRPRRAEAELVGLDGPEVDLLRAEAASLTGDHDKASRAFAALNDTARAQREAWRAGEWSRLEDGPDRTLSRAGALISAQQDAAPSDEEGVLARNRDLLDRSGTSRDVLDQLLQDTLLSRDPS